VLCRLDGGLSGVQTRRCRPAVVMSWVGGGRRTFGLVWWSMGTRKGDAFSSASKNEQTLDPACSARSIIDNEQKTEQKNLCERAIESEHDLTNAKYTSSTIDQRQMMTGPGGE
jgi:hypothetical protein